MTGSTCRISICRRAGKAIIRRLAVAQSAPSGGRVWMLGIVAGAGVGEVSRRWPMLRRKPNYPGLILTNDGTRELRVALRADRKGNASKLSGRGSPRYFPALPV
jgi:hypothetical protein